MIFPTTSADQAALSRRDLLLAGGAGIIAATAATPAAAAARKGRATEADVLIIGAGLAGLMAATLLQEQGVKAVVLEGANRIGGRTYTLNDLPGRPEAGGVQVGSNYARLVALAGRYNVALVPGGAFDRSSLYHIRGKTLTEAQWPTSEANLLVGPERNIPPAALGQVFARRMPSLATPQAWMTDAGRAIDVAYDAALRQAGASDEAIRLIASNTERGQLGQYSALNPARSAAIFASAGPQAKLLVIKEGSQRLAEAVAGGLKTPPRLQQLVTGIREDADGVTVALAGGRSLKARHVICTIPFAALHGVRLDGPSAMAMQPAIQALPYSHASFAYLTASDPFWNHDGLPRMLWSDDPLIGRVFVLGDDPAMLKVWLAGPDAIAIDRLPAAEAGAAIIARLEAARPSGRGKLRLARMFSWQQNPLARGTYHQIGTGQWPLLTQAVGQQGQRLHFAGEHLAQTTSGMEGALESGERAARTVLAML